MLMSCNAKDKAQESLISTEERRRKHGQTFNTVYKSYRGSAIVAGNHQITWNRCAQHVTQPVSRAKRCDSLVQCVDQRKRLHSCQHAHSDVAFLGEMDQGEKPWLAKIDLEAVETRTLTEIKFKLETGADMTVISRENNNVGRPKLWESRKTLLGTNQRVSKTSGNFCGRRRHDGGGHTVYMSLEVRRDHY